MSAPVWTSTCPSAPATPMGTHNHRLRLGDSIYLEIVAVDPEGVPPGRARWFGLDDARQVRADWEEGRRLRGWVARVPDIGAVLSKAPGPFGDTVPLPPEAPTFAFSIPAGGTLPLDGAIPSLIDHRGDMTHIPTIPDLGARLVSLTLEHPDPVALARLYRRLEIDTPPHLRPAPRLRYRAEIATPDGPRVLT